MASTRPLSSPGRAAITTQTIGPSENAKNATWTYNAAMVTADVSERPLLSLPNPSESLTERQM